MISISSSYQSYAVTQSHIDEFHKKGWFVIENLFSTDELDRVKQGFDALETTAAKIKETQTYEGAYFVLETNEKETIIHRVVWAGGYQQDLLRVGDDPRIIVPVAQLLESKEFDHLLNQAHFKRPKDGVFFDWHQDIQHRDKGPGTWEDKNQKGSYVQTALIVDEMREDNGPLLFVPGSSKWGRVDFGNHSYDTKDYEKKAPEQFREEDAQIVTAKPGSVLFFGPYTAHASFANNSDHSRRILINGYAYPGANHRVYPGEGSGRRLSI